MKVAVIGAGASGLTAIKTCKEYNFDVVCFEKNDFIGGLWQYADSGKQGCVMKSTVANSSKEMMSFSDFPPPKEFPNFLHNTKVLQYLHLYAETFNLLPHINLRSPIESVKQEGVQWSVTYFDENSNSHNIETFDAVFICTGHHIQQHRPHFEDMDEFKGQILHTQDLRTRDQLNDQIAVVVGFGNSAVDAATELALSCQQVYLSVRRANWVSPRIDDYGFPIDFNFTRFFAKLFRIFPRIVDKYMQQKCKKRFDHELYGLRPECNISGQHPVINDALVCRIADGSIRIKPDILRFNERGIVFKDGSQVDADTVVIATGYTIEYPFLDDNIISIKDNKLSLYLYMYSPQINNCQTLVIIGCIQPIGSVFPITEMQCRLACEVLQGNVKLPKREQMEREIEETRQQRSKRYLASRRHTIQVDYGTYMDILGKIIGVLPRTDLLHWIFDPMFTIKVVFHPQYSYQYRLQGPHVWPGARNAIETAKHRAWYSTQFSKSRNDSKLRLSSWSKMFIRIAVMFVVFSGLLFFCT